MKSLLNSISNIDNFLNELLQENTLDHIDLGFFDQMNLENSPDSSDLKQFNVKDIMKLKLDKSGHENYPDFMLIK